MDAPPPHSDMPAPPPNHAPGPKATQARTELLLDALKASITTPGEHRLFRAGKLPGLFPTRVGPAAEASLWAIKDGLLETTRTEVKGKVVTEWVRATPKAVGFVHDHDSPKSVLRELKDVLTTARGGVPAWLDESRREVAALAERFEDRATAVIQRLDDLAARVEAALRRAEASAPTVGTGVTAVVPWATDALEYLDRRTSAGSAGDCPLPELFHAVRANSPTLTLPAFQDGVRRLHDLRAVRLTGAADDAWAMTEPEYALVADGRLAYWVGR